MVFTKPNFKVFENFQKFHAMDEWIDGQMDRLTDWRTKQDVGDPYLDNKNLAQYGEYGDFNKILKLDHSL